MKDTRECQELENSKLIIDMPVERIVKNHLDIILLSKLIEKSMCGYDLIKEIYAQYNVLISQGTVYPLLYSMKEEGILQVESTKDDMKTKRYFVTQYGRQIVEKKVDEFIKVERSILNSIKKDDTYV
ncbi:Transcriptional regulator PadR-like family protein [uncultured archaeon]|nr:Transcriptional regulator PadR-like family protein [uncultured archaeon]